jgi:hypothetical protein
MSIADVTEANILKLYFNATAIANIADNAATSPITNIQVALHTADPADAGTQATSETTYTSYARVAVARTTGGWTVSGTSPTQAAPVATIAFPAGTGGSGTVTNFSAGKTSSGATDIFWSGTVTPNITVGSGVTPQLSTSTTITLD